mmetsp:Transcript_50/g.64  ORF Transcript_50/g.64 Transcript_50/m.64 type:complete len:619 (-) Transcript_50:94-1950(-)
MDTEKRDYEYYKAHAKDVDLEDITSSDHNANLLMMLRDGDPDWNGKFFLLNEEIDGDSDEFIVDDDDCMGWLGFFLGSSEHVVEFGMRFFPEGKDEMEAFMEGFKHNKSLRELYISTDLGSDGYKSLGYMLRHNDNLSSICLHEFVIGLDSARGIASMLGHEQCKTLKHLFFVQNDLSVEGLVDIVTALKKQPQLEELKVCGNNLDSDGCKALKTAFYGWEGASLKYLHLCHNNIDDEGVGYLVSGMARCNYLEALTLCGNPSITTAGFRSLSTFLLSKTCCLERLDLDQTNVDCKGAGALVAGLSSNKSLKCLCLSGNSIDDEGIDVLVSCLPKCSKLEELHLSENGGISALGLKSLSNAFQAGSNLKHLRLRDNSIDDKGLKALVEGMANCRSLTKLDLSRNEAVTATGLQALLRAGRSSLEELELWGIRIGDDGASTIANELVGNNVMERLYFCPSYSNITSKGWSAFSRLLCDYSTVNDTYLSNHIISNIGAYRSGSAPNTSRFHLFLNNNFHSSDAAMLKILMHHHDINMLPFFRWKLMFLPLVVDWFERAKQCWMAIHLMVPGGHILESSDMSALHEFFREGSVEYQSKELSAVYKFVRNAPMLAIGKEQEE